MSMGRWPRIGIPWSGGGGPVGLGSPIQVVQANNTASATELICTLSSVSAGDVIVAYSAWESRNTSAVVTSSVGTFINGTTYAGANNRSAISYLLSSTNGGTGVNVVVTLDDDAGYRSFVVAQFRPSGGKTVAIAAAESSASGSGTTPTSGQISTDGGATLIGSAKSYALGGTFSNYTIAGSSASGIQSASAALWYRDTETAISSQTASSTFSSDAWIASAIAIKQE
jgi:hypothetical protein